MQNAIADVTVDEDADNTVIDLSEIFTDIDNDNNAIAITVSDNSNDSLVTLIISITNRELLTLLSKENRTVRQLMKPLPLK